MVEIRLTRRADAPAVAGLAERGFADSPDMKVWDEENVLHHVEVFPEGQFVAVEDRTGKVIGSATSMRVRADVALRRHTWREVTGGSNLANHDPTGEILYGVDVVVHPRYRVGGVGRHLYQAREDLLARTDCLGFAAGGRLPNYHLFARHGMPAEEYVRLVEDRVVRDPVLGFQLKRGMTPLDVLPGYITDARSGNWACLIYYPNPSCGEDAEAVVSERRKFSWDPPKRKKRDREPPAAPSDALPAFDMPKGVARRIAPREPAKGRPKPRQRA